MRQVLCVWFPNWPVQRMLAARPELKGRAVVLHSALEGRSPSVTACCSRAERWGVRVGMPLAEAQTLVPSGRFFTEDVAEDREHLRQLAWSCQRFAPHVALEDAVRPECLALDVTGCGPHFGNLSRFCEQVAESFRQNRYRVRIAATATFGAAWAAAHLIPGKHVVLLDSERLRESLAPLPIEGLRLPEKQLSLLTECGLRTIGHVLNLPRASLPSRFGPELLLRIDQALGDVAELLPPELPPEPIRAEARFEFALGGLDEVSAALQPLLFSALADLQRRGRETQHLRVTWKTEDGQGSGFDIRLLSPTSRADRFRELLSLHLEQLRLEGGVALLQVEAMPCRAGSVRRRTLFDTDDEQAREFLHLIERLTSRLGPQAVVRARLLPEVQPELVVVAEPWLSGERGRNGKEDEVRPSRPCRPLRLLAAPVRVPAITDETTGRPLRFRWRFRDHLIARCEGPERIETGWWRAARIRRDYYRVETNAGARFWLFRELNRANWFLQGVFE